MDYTYSTTDPAKIAGLAAAVDDYNNNMNRGGPGGRQRGSGNFTPITGAQLLDQQINILLNQWASKYNVGKIPSAAFILRFTAEEYAAITAAAAQNSQLQDYLNQLNAAPTVNLFSSVVIDGVAALVAAGLLAQDRVATILAA